MELIVSSGFAISLHQHQGTCSLVPDHSIGRSQAQSLSFVTQLEACLQYILPLYARTNPPLRKVQSRIIKYLGVCHRRAQNRVRVHFGPRHPFAVRAKQDRRARNTGHCASKGFYCIKFICR